MYKPVSKYMTYLLYKQPLQNLFRIALNENLKNSIKISCDVILPNVAVILNRLMEEIKPNFTHTVPFHI